MIRVLASGPQRRAWRTVTVRPRSPIEENYKPRQWFLLLRKRFVSTKANSSLVLAPDKVRNICPVDRALRAAVLVRQTYVESVIVDAYAQRISPFHFVYLISHGQVSLASKRVRSKRLRELKLDKPISSKFRSYPRVSTSESEITHLASYLLIVFWSRQFVGRASSPKCRRLPQQLWSRPCPVRWPQRLLSHLPWRTPCCPS